MANDDALSRRKSSRKARRRTERANDRSRTSRRATRHRKLTGATADATHSDHLTASAQQSAESIPPSSGEQAILQHAEPSVEAPAERGPETEPSTDEQAVAETMNRLLSPGSRLLGIYLRDHYTGSRAALELAKRVARNNRDTKLADFLHGFIVELELDRDLLASALEALGAKPSRVKQTGAWLVEKLGRLKPNGRLMRYSPSSRLLEIESLALGVEGKIALWRALVELKQREPRLETIELEPALQRGEAQRAALEEFRLAAAAQLFE